ncbi:MAG: hypothetical protein ACRC0E_08440 [Soonwooa sp.]
MLKKIYLLASFLMAAFGFAQINKDIKTGVITTVTNEKIAAIDFKWDKNGKASFLNASNKQMEDLYENSIKSLEPIEENAENLSNITNQKALNPSVKKLIDDGLYRPMLPEGIYVTKQEFIDKVPSQKKQLSKRGLYGFEKPVLEDADQICFFFDEKESKLKNVFAVVQNGILYFSIKAILDFKNRNKNDRAQDSDNPNSFARSTIGGNNYYYAEINVGNVWAKGLAMGTGGTGGYAMMQSQNSYKGIVWDSANQEFNIFKNCKDYNDFIKDKSPQDVQECTTNQPDNFRVRKAIEKIK